MIIFLGISGAGKTTCSKILVDHLNSNNIRAINVDDDAFRKVIPQEEIIRVDYPGDQIRKPINEARRLEALGYVVVLSIFANYNNFFKSFLASKDKIFEIINTGYNIKDKEWGRNKYFKPDYSKLEKIDYLTFKDNVNIIYNKRINNGI